ncbi:MAG: hypothetical protein J6S40_07525 [Thermoguttaceae bacterium]|nr:hypothetical protein [Thermoguttaceae bacterium]
MSNLLRQIGCGRAIFVFLSLALLVSFVGGCANLKCGLKDSSPTSVSPNPPAPIKDECDSSCPATPASHSSATVSVSGSEPAPDGSVVSGEEIPQTVSQDLLPPAPPVTIDSTANRYLNNQGEEILRNPNGNPVPSSVSPAGYQGSAPEPPQQINGSEIPDGYIGMTQTSQYNGQFQNVSQETQPSRSRIQFRTVIEE